MTIEEYKQLCKKDVLRIGQDVSVIKLGTEVKSKYMMTFKAMSLYWTEATIMLLLKLGLLTTNFRQ